MEAENEALVEVLTRGIGQIYPSKKKAEEILSSGKKLRVYMGIDPTSAEIHIGHLVPLLFLKRLMNLGHQPVLLIGDFTARIGDPTGKDLTARKQLTAQEVEANMATYWEQIGKILPLEKIEQRHNAEWFEKMALDDFIRLAAETTVQQMIARDMFQKRMERQKPIGVHEFLYPIMQGYDSVALGVDGEVGGKDQTFNMLVGRDMLAGRGKEKLIFAMKLLEDPVSGKKMSKTESNFIALNNAPDEMFGKTMALPDEMIAVVFECATEVPMAEIENMEEAMTGGENPKKYKIKLAKELVAMYHGREAAEKAEENFERIFAKKETPDEMPEHKIGPGEKIIDVIVSAGLAESKSEAKHLIEQKAATIGGKAVENWNYEPKKGEIIKIGSRKFVKIV